MSGIAQPLAAPLSVHLGTRVFRLKRAGETLLGATAEIGRTGWRVVVRAPAATVANPFVWRRYALWAAGVLAALLTLLLIAALTLAWANQREARTLAKTNADLADAVADRTALLQEVHHRVKNNLQMLTDLVYLRAADVESADGRLALEESASRIGAIARLHEQLYLSLDAGKVRLADYLRRLAEGLEQIHLDRVIRLDLRADDACLELDRAIHTGLLVNELFTNAVKHAYAEGQRGEIGIGLTEADGCYEIRVWDAGRGLPTSVNVGTAETLGLRLVRILSTRLRAAVTTEPGPGTRFLIRIPAAPEVYPL